MAFSFINLFAQTDTGTTPTEIPTELPPEVQTEITNQLNSVPVDYTTTTADAGILAGVGLVFLLIYLVVIAFFVICSIKIFQKAGRKWWEAIIPIYSTYVLLQIIKRPGWWLLLFFVPLVNIVVAIIVSIDLAKVFGKDTVFAILGLIIFGFVGYPILAFGSAKYIGDGTSSSNDNTPTPAAPKAPEAPTAPQSPSTPPSNLVQ